MFSPPIKFSSLGHSAGFLTPTKSAQTFIRIQIMGRVALYLNEAAGDFSLRVQNHCLSVRMTVASQIKSGITNAEAKTAFLRTVRKSLENPKGSVNQALKVQSLQKRCAPPIQSPKEKCNLHSRSGLSMGVCQSEPEFCD
jgi:hypothetical protein